MRREEDYDPKHKGQGLIVENKNNMEKYSQSNLTDSNALAMRVDEDLDPKHVTEQRRRSDCVEWKYGKKQGGKFNRCSGGGNEEGGGIGSYESLYDGII